MFILHKEMPEERDLLIHSSKIGYRPFGEMAHRFIPFSLQKVCLSVELTIYTLCQSKI